MAKKRWKELTLFVVVVGIFLVFSGETQANLESDFEVSVNENENFVSFFCHDDGTGQFIAKVLLATDNWMKQHPKREVLECESQFQEVYIPGERRTRRCFLMILRTR